MLAIDFGTSGLRAAVVNADGVRRLMFDGEPDLPAAVAFSELGEGGKPLVGATAERMAAVTPDDVSIGIKRLLGLPFASPHVRALSARLRHPVAALASGEVGVQIGGKLRHPIEIAARLLARVREEAPEQERAVVAVPSNFDCSHRHALSAAARIAGLSELRVLSEPLAAALGRTNGDGTFLVCDLGAGVADVAVVRRLGRTCEVIGSSADAGWGGDDIDAALARHLGDQATMGTGVDLNIEPEAAARFRVEVRRLKESMASSDENRLYLPMLTVKDDGSALDVDRMVKREEVISLLEPLLRRLELPCQEALAMSATSPESIDDVLLCGGGADLVCVSGSFEQWVGRPARVVDQPTRAVLDGAVAMAKALRGDTDAIIALDRLPATLGLAEGDIYAPVLAAGSPLPTRVHKLVATRAEGQRELVVALYQGESSHIGHNHLVGLYGVEGLPTRPAGETLVQVTLLIDESGLLFLDARELASAEPLQFKRLGGPGLTGSDAEALSDELSEQRA